MLLRRLLGADSFSLSGRLRFGQPLGAAASAPEPGHNEVIVSLALAVMRGAEALFRRYERIAGGGGRRGAIYPMERPLDPWAAQPNGEESPDEEFPWAQGQDAPHSGVRTRVLSVRG